MNPLKFVRPQKLAENIIFVDGLSGSGKTLIAPLLSTLEHGELWKFNYPIEYLCTLDASSAISRSSAETFIQLLFDLDLYNLMIARETNLRPTDASGAVMNLLGKRYDKRLKIKDGDSVVQKIKTERPFLIMMLHFQFIQSQLLFETFKDRLKLYAISVRHPFWLIENWYRGAWHRGIQRHYGGGWGERFGRDPREFTLCCEIDENVVPWFAVDWYEEYIRMKPLDQAIQTVYRLNERIEKRFNKMLEQDQEKVLFIPFELFVAEPELFIQQLTQILKTQKTPLTQKMMKKIQVPRQSIWFDEIQNQKKKVHKWMDQENVLPESRQMADQMASAYEQRYLEKVLFAQRM